MEIKPANTHTLLTSGTESIFDSSLMSISTSTCEFFSLSCPLGMYLNGEESIRSSDHSCQWDGKWSPPVHHQTTCISRAKIPERRVAIAYTNSFFLPREALLCPPFAERKPGALQVVLCRVVALDWRRKIHDPIFRWLLDDMIPFRLSRCIAVTRWSSSPTAARPP